MFVYTCDTNVVITDVCKSCFCTASDDMNTLMIPAAYKIFHIYVKLMQC